MKKILLEIIRCPQTGQLLKLDAIGQSISIILDSVDDVVDGWLVSEDGLCRYPIRNGIPRFVPESNYSNNFGMQWNLFAKTQLDSYSGVEISADRFWKATNWSAEELRDKWVLDVGCGSGRFAEVALKSGAQVVALDYSSAVDACRENLKHFPNLHVVQGDIFHLPFASESFSFVYSLGVLQHTPSPEKAFFSMVPIIKRGGFFCVDCYWRRLSSLFHAKYIFRVRTKYMNHERLFSMLEGLVPKMLTLSRIFGRTPIIGKYLKRIVPVADYRGIYPLSSKQLEEWALLDTFDMLAPAYDYPQTKNTLVMWMKKAGFVNIEALHATLLVVRGRKSEANLSVSKPH